MSFTSNFDQAYQKLNLAQKKAVDTLDGPVLVLAGPGTGKTQVLTTRIANIIKETDTEPSDILALTFTEAATKEMRQRLINLIGPAGYQVKVSTFHGFCAGIIADNPERFNRSVNLVQITELRQFQIINQILEKGDFALLKPAGAPLLYTKDINQKITDLKREGITPQKFLEHISIFKDMLEAERDSLKKGELQNREKTLSKNLDLLDIYQKYQEALSKQNLYDYSDMINWVVESFESDKDFLLTYQEKFQSILVDEYQDTNSSQNRLVFALSNYWDNPNLFVVGDSDQSIFRFQGASKENILEFQSRYPNSTQITLNQNYRSTKTILNSSAKLFGNDSLNTNVEIKDKPLKLAKFSSAIFENEFIANSIKRKIKQGISPSEIAVIVRNNSDIDELLPIFKQKNIPFKIAGDNNILKTPLISQFLNLLRVTTQIQGSLDDLDLFIALNYPHFQINPFSVLQASRRAHQEKTSLADYLTHDNPDLDDRLVDIFRQIVGWNAKATHQTATEIFQTIFTESGLQEYILSLPLPITELNRFATLFDEVKSQSQSYPGLNLFGFVQNLLDMADNDLKLKENILTTTEEAVTLTTAHKSKGLEWLVVYIYRFVDSRWSNQHISEKIKLVPGIINYEDLSADEDNNSEERRLFYVALTRAKQQIYITGADEYEKSSKMIFPALFYHELPQENLIKLNTKIYERSTAKVISANLSQNQPIVLSSDEAKYLTEIIKEIRLSPTSLNNYLQCPYRYKLDNLYRLPKAKNPAMCFGTAIHYALEQLFISINNNQKVSKEDLISDFEVALKREILTESDQRSQLKHGHEVLTSFYDEYYDNLKPSLFTEKDFGKSLTSQVVLDDIPLDGKVDRIDLISQKDKTVRVIDYKTGKPKSRNDIEGTNKNSTGDYKRQLVFYHLLAELDKSFPYKVVQSVLQFVEQNDSGYFKSEVFNITPEEISELKDTIRKAYKGIISLQFGRTTDTKNCEKCPFLTHCWPEGFKSSSEQD